MYHNFVGLLLTICFIMTHCCGLSQAVPIIGKQTQFDDNSKVQGKLKPIFVYCDEIGNHLNCMLFCRSMGHTSGNCGGDFICDCF